MKVEYKVDTYYTISDLQAEVEKLAKQSYILEVLTNVVENSLVYTLVAKKAKKEKIKQKETRPNNTEAKLESFYGH